MTTVLTHPTARRIRPDEELAAGVRNGDAAAFEAIVERYGPALIPFARQILGGAHHDAEEAVQDAFVKALTALRRPDDRELTLKPWLYAITRNACLDRLRKPNRTVDITPMETVLSDRSADPHEAAVRHESLRVVLGGLQELPARQREALVMHELEGRSHEHMARRLHVSVGASKALVCRGRQNLAHLRPAA